MLSGIMSSMLFVNLVPPRLAELIVHLHKLVLKTRISLNSVLLNFHSSIILALHSLFLQWLLFTGLELSDESYQGIVILIVLEKMLHHYGE